MGWVANGVPTDAASTIPNPQQRLVVAQSSPDTALRPQSRWGPGCGRGGPQHPLQSTAGRVFWMGTPLRVTARGELL